MRVHKELFNRWEKYVRLLLAEHSLTVEKIVSPRTAWDIASRLDIPREAYKFDLNDNHIETALRRIFPNAWQKKSREEN